MRKLRLLPCGPALVAGAVVAVALALFVLPTAAEDAAAKDSASQTSDADNATKGTETKPEKGVKKQPAKKNAAAKKAAAKDRDAVEPADNSYCLVCHLNYEAEKLTASHQKVGVGCAKCHGESEKHSGDEDGLTAPDVIFAHVEVDKFCMSCHPEDKIAKNENHKDIFAPAEKADEHLYCTECHGENHRMAVRTRKWDKTTRKLISDDGVRMMYKDSPATNGVPEASKKAK